MTQSEKDFVKLVAKLSMELVGTLGNMEMDLQPGTKEYQRAQRASAKALELADLAFQRLNGEAMASEQARVTTLDLADLAGLPKGKAPEPTEAGE